MKTTTIIKLAIWFICFILLLNESLDMISDPNTVENIIGYCLLIIILIISFKTKCLTKIKFKNNEKENL